MFLQRRHLFVLRMFCLMYARTYRIDFFKVRPRGIFLFFIYFPITLPLIPQRFVIFYIIRKIFACLGFGKNIANEKSFQVQVFNYILSP
jgi:hypothetical protein